MYACIDLGSNSFHLLVARWVDGHCEIVERFSNKVQLGEGVATTGHINQEAFRRGLLCLQEFREVVDRHPVKHYWALGTNALRIADNAADFVAAAREIGFEVAVISGIQEAMLVYAGVISGLPASPADRLVIDIGGGSTEIIVGNGKELYLTESLPVGCVSWRDRWFADQAVDENELSQSLDAATEAAREVFMTVKDLVDKYPFTEVYASSGTAKMLSAVCRENGFGEGQITFTDLMSLRPLILSAIARNKPLAGLKDNRRDLVLPGWSVLTALMQTYAVNTVSFSPTALREGMLDFLVNHPEMDAEQTAALPEITSG